MFFNYWKNHRNVQFLIGLSLILIVASIPSAAWATPGVTYLPLVFRLQVPQAGQEIKNPGFEAGYTGWYFYLPAGDPIIVNNRYHVPTHSAELGIYIDQSNPGGPSYARTASIDQKIYIPADRTTLQYFDYIFSEEDADSNTGQCYQAEILGDWVRVYVNGSVILKTSLCKAINTPDWVMRKVDLSSYTGKFVDFKIEFKSDATINSDYYVDDFSLVTGP